MQKKSNNSHNNNIKNFVDKSIKLGFNQSDM